MLWTRIACAGILLCCALPSLADPPTPPEEPYAGCLIDVQGWSNRPPNTPEAYVEIRNRGGYYCLVEISRTFEMQEPATNSCVGCHAGSCAGASADGVSCTTTKIDTISVNPCGGAGSCSIPPIDCMPAHNEDLHDCCDNALSSQTGHCNHPNNTQHPRVLNQQTEACA